MSSLQDLKSFSFVMIKPHAVKQGYELLLLEILNDIEKYVERYKIVLSEQSLQILKGMRIVTSMYKNIPEQGQLLRAIYNDNITERGEEHFQTLSEFYSGEVMFIVLGNTTTQKEFEDALNEFKGQCTLFNEEGETVRNGYGVRGILIEPGVERPGEYSSNIISPRWFNNIIHVADIKEDTALVLKIILGEKLYELSDLGAKGLVTFIENNLKLSMIKYEG